MDIELSDVFDASSQAGITCTACHAISHTNSPRGNADYTIEEPIHYPFAFSENAALRWVNRLASASRSAITTRMGIPICSSRRWGRTDCFGTRRVAS